ncbi:EF-P beta-lysylation protein EpmB [Rubinisphaera margarita]|uniref:EF-P beta-lysylation protein EpmB n=1 Tax=Rubinisphaera margarita TaxID=2909586 RepID=UPI001EE8770B|nr:EF-P beta-lysylation protein EpmB [Rubinisphaera margarita]MCG6157818.1 EF-P beta-lysylation protein EpmB [Rubinisphaera margarita]
MDKTALNAFSQVTQTISADLSPPKSLWQKELAAAWRSPAELLEHLDLIELLPSVPSDVQEFPLLAPHSFVRRMQPGNPADPLLRQILPVQSELLNTEGFAADPVHDQDASPLPGMIHKYANRVLLITTGTCAVHCRYCFRRHFPYEAAPRSLEQWDRVLEELAGDRDVDEVILSGGDPLTWTDSRLQKLIARLAEIPQLERIRVHSRLPVVLPERVTDELIAALTSTRLQPVFVIHANHGQEIADDARNQIQRLARSGFPVLNQAVLLRGVNDSVDAQAELCRRLINIGVIPYYVNQLDRVQGAAHFEVPIEEGRRILGALKDLLPGYAVPRYVIDVPGQGSKTEIVCDLPRE